MVYKCGCVVDREGMQFACSEGDRLRQEINRTIDEYCYHAFDSENTKTWVAQRRAVDNLAKHLQENKP